MTALIDDLFNRTAKGLEYERDLEERLLSTAGYVAASVTLIFIGLFGFCFNLFVIIFMWKGRKSWTTQTIIVFNIICCDFAVAILGTPIPITASIWKGWIFGQGMCEMYGFFMALLGINSITTLTALAFERYMVVCKPFRKYRLNRTSTKLIVAGIWIYSLVLTTPPLVGWGKYVNEAANISCSVNWEEQSPNALTYILFLFTFGFFIPVIVIVVSYSRIFYTMRQSNIRLAKRTKTESRVAYMILLMIGAFLLAWTPYAVLALLVQFKSSSILSPAIAVIPAILAKSSICYNPIIYVGLNKQFRKDLNFGKRKDRNTTGTTCDTYKLGARYASTPVTHPPDSEQIFLQMSPVFSKQGQKWTSTVQHPNEKESTIAVEVDGKTMEESRV